jgi:2-keto-4-pentenoate hydratase/2-oxohepta-3-ene-1,7-dioic acid hydratase in catechol pathway
MRLVRFSTGDGAVAVGVVENDEIAELANPTDRVPLGQPLELSGRRWARSQVRLLAPIARPPKFLAIGKNYAAHTAEMGMPAPDAPLFFNKQSTCVTGPTDDIWVPRDAASVDYEGELGVVIGRSTRRVGVEEALGAVGGYLVVNDVSVREWQRRSPTFTLGKSFDTHGPIGPWVVTPDEVPDPQDLRIRTWVNDELRQDGSTSQMVLPVAEQIAYLSQSMTLEAGDVITTGTPAGVGAGFDPPRWLVPGDTVTVEIDGIGRLENRVIAEPA